jgi:hypothetical protein
MRKKREAKKSREIDDDVIGQKQRASTASLLFFSLFREVMMKRGAFQIMKFRQRRKKSRRFFSGKCKIPKNPRHTLSQFVLVIKIV